MLEFLFYVKEKGNLTSHPNKSETEAVNNNKNSFYIPENYKYINQVKENIKGVLQDEFVKIFFIGGVKPKALFDCIFESKFKPLIKSEKNEEMDNKIDTLLNELLGEMDGVTKVDKIFNNFSEKLNELKEIYSTLNENKSKQGNILMSLVFKEFLGKINNILTNDKKCISFLMELNSNNEYETSITGENYVFFSNCLDYIIKKVLFNLEDKINEYQSFQEQMKNLIEFKSQILYILNNLNKKLSNLEELQIPIIDSKEMSEYVNQKINNPENEIVDVSMIRKNLEKLVTKPIDWTARKNINLSTLLYLGQNKK